MRSRAHNMSRTDRYESCPVGRVGDLPEEPIHQPAVDSLLSLEPFSRLDAKVVADKVRRGVTQHVVGGVDRVKSSADPLLCRFGAQETHVSTLSNTCANYGLAGDAICG